MYNGIGLSTVRGSGTSGHVQANKFAVRNRAGNSGYGPDRRNGTSSSSRPKQPNAAILEHNRLREIEVKLAELEDELEEKGYVVLKRRKGETKGKDGASSNSAAKKKKKKKKKKLTSSLPSLQ